MESHQEETPPQRVPGRFSSLRRPALIVVGYLIIWFILSVATQNLRGELDVSLWYPPSGLSFALLLICGVRYAPAIVLTALAHYLLHRGGAEYPLWVLLGLPVLYTAVYVGAAALLVHKVKIDPRLSRMRDLLYFVGIGCLAAPFVGSAVAVAGYAVVGRIPWDGFVVNTLGGWAGEATGVGVVTTLLLVGLRPFPSMWSSLSGQPTREEQSPWKPLKGFSLPGRHEILELAGQVVLLGTIMFVAYGTNRGVQLDFAYLVFLPLIWVAVRGDLARTTVCVLLINVGAVLLVGGTVANSNPILIQFGLLTLTIVGLLLGGLVTEQRETAGRLVREASHDRLTGLPNRTLFSDKLSDGATTPGDGFVVLAVGLDQFADINNALGYRTGDRLLVAVAERFSVFTSASAPDSTSTAEASTASMVRVARTGDDTFAGLVKGVVSEGRAADLSEKLLEELARPYEIEGREVYATASAGVVMVGEAPEEAEDLLRDAYTALQSAKVKGTSRYVIFDRVVGEAAKERLALDTDLRRAVEQEEFVLHYQPVFSLQTDTVVGVEALVRWEHPERGLLPPAEFIALAEQSGVIVPLGEWILREACTWAKGQRGRHPSEPPVIISVNLSAKQLEHPGFPGKVEAVLEETGLDPRALVLEITESALVDNTDSIYETLHDSMKNGVRLAVDDFGTGYSSLAYLGRLPIDIVKIDRSFISKLADGSSVQDDSGESFEKRSANEKLVSGIIDLAHGQNLTVVAEGVENILQLERLRKTDCDMVQGYWFSKPLTDGEVVALIQSHLG